MFDIVGKVFTGGLSKKNMPQPQARRSIKSEKKARSNRGIAYDAQLIENLEEDHEKLVEIFGKIWEEGYLESDFELLCEYLAEFKALFQSHLLKENVKFYAYLEGNLKGDSHSLGVVREFRKDMNDIGNAVIGFCKTYDQPEHTKGALEKFKEDYRGIGQALVRRVQVEERDLFSLYSPS